jgi:hypothetical protein
MGTVDAVLSNATVTTNGSYVFRAGASQEVSIVIHIANAPTGTSPTIVFTITEVDPADESTQVGISKSSTTINAAGTQVVTMLLVNSPTAKISWTVGGTTPSFSGTTVTAFSKLVATTVRGTIKPVYGAANQGVTITLASLGAAASRASTAINNSTTLYEDVLFWVKVCPGSTVVATSYFNVYGYASDGTAYPEGITGTDSAVTLTSPPNLPLLAQVNTPTANTVKIAGPFSFCRTFGVDRLPLYWGLVVSNLTTGTANATASNFAIWYQGINGQVV